MPKVFVSYSHEQREWVWSRLVPVLKAAGAEVLIDVERFKAGTALPRQMDAAQDAADRQLLCFSDEYLKSKACDHEWRRAVQSDSDFSKDMLVPVVLSPGMKLPDQIRTPDPLYVDMCKDRDAAKWDLLLRSLGLTWNCSPVSWLAAVEETARKLQHGDCVNLRVPKSPSNSHHQPVDALLAQLCEQKLPRELMPHLKVIDLNAGETSSLWGLLTVILQQAGMHHELPRNKSEALVQFSLLMQTLKSPLVLTLRSGDLIGNSERQKKYGSDFFAALFALTQPKDRKLVLLFVSHSPYVTLLPKRDRVSAINFTTVELQVT